MKLILTLIGCIAAVSALPARFDGHQVLRTYPTSAEHVEKLVALGDTYDFWSTPKLNVPTDIRVDPVNNALLRQFLTKLGIKYEILIKDLQKRIYWESKSMGNSVNAAFDWTSYHSTTEIQNFLVDISAQHKDISEVITIGKSTEGRDLKLIRIGANGGTRKKAYFMDGGIHAREWISPAITTWFVNELLSNRNKYTALLNQVDFYILPVANVDGYEYTRSSSRMWRKTRSINSGSTCVGVDPNRNFDVEFGGPGTSSSPCSEIYKGEKAFSEPETKAIRDFVVSRGKTTADWKIYNAIHSYAQMILTPWGYTYDLPADYRKMRDLGDKAAAALKAVHGTQYKVGSVTEILSAGAGGSDDWAYGSGNFEYSYTIEVRDTGAYGFILPPQQIIPTAQETFQAVLTMANALI
ncbi:unnamed protein product [Allacma fusca]|uniref:Peptidase M14 domain-containing protein n=1 Tax=Allacma fusca TaxID=39272 RepID=A0A8J2KMD9_9HEXA|nr:unnamed protein product [Allacma fusca]